MLGDGRNRRDHPKARALCRILKLDQRILIRAVSVNTNQNRLRTVSPHHTQALRSHSRDSPAIRGHRDHGYILFCHRNRAKTKPAIGQIYSNGFPFQRIGNVARRLFCSTRRAKHDIEYLHRIILPFTNKRPKRPRAKTGYNFQDAPRETPARLQVQSRSELHKKKGPRTGEAPSHAKSNVSVTHRTVCRRRSGPASSRRPRSPPWHPRQRARSEATQRKRAMPAAREHPVGWGTI